MNNLEFWNAIKEFDEHKNPYGNELVCDQIVIQGLGQTKGGHFVTACEPRYIDYIDAKMNRSEKMPTYANLKCPQLIMYIAEMAGLDVEIVDKAFNFLKDFKEEIVLKEIEAI